MNNKKGISAIVATVLIILITVAAVTIIWAAIIPMISNELGGATECFDASAALTVSSDYSCYNATTGNVSIRVANAQWEDAFNCIRCSGNISDIEVRNAVSDGVDIDFSDLELGSVVVLASGNDCVDVSSGKYLIHELKAEACGDKALSIGEASQMSVRNLQVTRASIGIAIKDSSVLYRPENYRDLFNFVDVITDFATYNKKQEYGTGRIIETTQY